MLQPLSGLDAAAEVKRTRGDLVGGEKFRGGVDEVQIEGVRMRDWESANDGIYAQRFSLYQTDAQTAAGLAFFLTMPAPSIFTAGFSSPAFSTFVTATP